MSLDDLKAYVAEYAATFDERFADPRVVEMERFYAWLNAKLNPAADAVQDSNA